MLFLAAGSTSLALGATDITPNPTDLAAAPASFTITGADFADAGFGLPVVNFERGGVLLGQVRATGLTGGPQPQSTITGLDFPGSNNGAFTVRFKFANPQDNGLPIYGPGGNGVTYIWRAYPRRQPSYYTAFFWGNDDGQGNTRTFEWVASGVSDTYYGAHPFPRTALSDTHDWEIAVENADFVNGAVEYNRWYTQALRVWSDADGKHHEFYWDLPNTDASHRVTKTSPPSWGNTNPPAPALTWGDAPWNPGREVWDGVLRGFQIYSALLSLADIQSEATAPLSTSAGMSSIWYMNTNPTPLDISDKSGRGHHPAWVGIARPALYADSIPPLTSSLTVPYPTNLNSLSGALPGLSAGAVTVSVYNQTSASSFSLVAGAVLTVAGCSPCVTGITPNPTNLAAAPGSFTITGGGFTNAGGGLPVVNFERSGVLLGQVRAAGLAGGTTLTVPYPTNLNSLSGALPGLSAGQMTVSVYNQTSASSFSLVGSVVLTATGCTICVTGITPNPIDLAAPGSFTITGGGFTNAGGGLPVVNFERSGVLLGQVRATGLTGGTTLTVPYPTNLNSLSGALPGLSSGPVTVSVYNQTSVSDFSLVGSISLTVVAPTGIEEAICGTPAVFFCANFEDYPLGLVQSGNFGRYKDNGWNISAGSLTDIQSEHVFSGTKAIRMVTQANKVSGGFMDSLGFFGGPRRTVYWRWYAKYSSNYIWSPVATKHNEELVGGNTDNGLFSFTGQNGTRTPVFVWLLNFNCWTSGTSAGCWFPPNTGGGFAGFTVNQWYCLEVRITLNTGSTATDGTLEAWIDDVKKYDYPNVNLKYVDVRGTPVSNQLIGGFFLTSYWNCDAIEDCSAPEYQHPDMYRYMDNLIGSTQRIGCLASTPDETR